MIRGEVDNALEPVVVVGIAKPGAMTRGIPVVIDTGYNGSLSLPPTLIQSFALTWYRTSRATLADGSEIEYEIFLAEIDWDGKTIKIEVDESDTTPLLGTGLLHGYELKAEMRPRGKVTLRKLPPKPRKTRS